MLPYFCPSLWSQIMEAEKVTLWRKSFKEQQTQRFPSQVESQRGDCEHGDNVECPLDEENGRQGRPGAASCQPEKRLPPVKHLQPLLHPALPSPLAEDQLRVLGGEGGGDGGGAGVSLRFEAVDPGEAANGRPTIHHLFILLQHTQVFLLFVMYLADWSDCPFGDLRLDYYPKGKGYPPLPIVGGQTHVPVAQISDLREGGKYYLADFFS